MARWYKVLKDIGNGLQANTVADDSRFAGCDIQWLKSQGAIVEVGEPQNGPIPIQKPQDFQVEPFQAGTVQKFPTEADTRGDTATPGYARPLADNGEQFADLCETLTRNQMAATDKVCQKLDELFLKFMATVNDCKPADTGAMENSAAAPITEPVAEQPPVVGNDAPASAPKRGNK